nr:TnsA endonuclease C-terminal domain-containing protein [Francisella philomiragia]
MRGPYLDNIRLVNNRKHMKYSSQEESRIIDYITNIGHSTIDHILEYLYVTSEQKGIALGQILGLIANHTLCCDMQAPINRKTMVWLNNRDNQI